VAVCLLLSVHRAVIFAIAQLSCFLAFFRAPLFSCVLRLRVDRPRGVVGVRLAMAKSALVHDLLFLPISTIESAVGKRLITHCCISRVACSRLSGHIEPHSPRLQA